MQIEIKDKKNITFNSIAAGQVFYCEAIYFMRLDTEVFIEGKIKNAVRLSDGQVRYFSREDLVYPAQAKMVVESPF
jgi:hypothetical protein